MSVLNEREKSPKHALLCRLTIRQQFIIAFSILFFMNLIAWTVFYPGYFQADHQQSIGYIASNKPSQWHSLLWGYVAYPLIYLSPSYAIYGLAQILFFCFAVIFSLWRLWRAKVIKGIIPSAVFFALFPTYLIYNLLYSSDICFAYCVMCITALLIELGFNGERCLFSISYNVFLCFWIILACELRKNGLMIAVVVFAVLFIVFRDRFKCIAVMLLSSTVLYFLMGPGLSFLVGATESPSQEMLSVPCTQIARVYYEAENGVEVHIPQDVNQGLTEIRSSTEWADTYLGYIADESKNGVRLSFDFVKNWVVLGLCNPEAYLRAYLTLDYPFWQFGATSLGDDYSSFANGSAIDFGDWDRVFTLEHKEVDSLDEGYLIQFGFEKSSQWLLPGALYWKVNLYHLPILTELVDFVFLNRALPFWILLAGVLVALQKKRIGLFFVGSAPVFAVVLSLLLFAPAGFMRYTMEAYYALPMLILLIAKMPPLDDVCAYFPARAEGSEQ